MVVLSSLQSARDLLEKRGSIYSDRPRFVLLSEMYVAVSSTVRNLIDFFFGKDGVGECIDSHAIVGVAASLLLGPH